MPSSTHRRPVLIAHRGWSTRFSENTAPAFAAAVAAGADELELDVRVSADGVPIICHDATLDRVSDLRGPVHEARIHELENARIRMPDGTWLTGLGFATLDDVLTWFGTSVVINLHVKETREPATIVDALPGRLSEPGMRQHYIAGDASVLAIARATCPEVPRCLVSTQTEPLRELLATATSLDCGRVQFFHGNCHREAVAEASRLGLTTNYFFADDVDTARGLMNMGIDALLTNDIGALRQSMELGRHRDRPVDAQAPD